MPTSFIRSTIEVRQFSVWPLSAAIFCNTASTSTGCAGACAGFAGAAAGALLAEGVRVAGGGLGGVFGWAAAGWPKIASLILLKMLIRPRRCVRNEEGTATGPISSSQAHA